MFRRAGTKYSYVASLCRLALRLALRLGLGGRFALTRKYRHLSYQTWYLHLQKQEYFVEMTWSFWYGCLTTKGETMIVFPGWHICNWSQTGTCSNTPLGSRVISHNPLTFFEDEFVALLHFSLIAHHPTLQLFSTRTFPGLDPLQSTPVPVSYTKYVTKHMSKIEMGKTAVIKRFFLQTCLTCRIPTNLYRLRILLGKHSLWCYSMFDDLVKMFDLLSY